VYRRVGDPSSRLRFLLRTGSSGSLDQRHAPGGGLDRYERVSLQAQRRDDRGRQDLWVPVADVLHCDGLVPQFLGHDVRRIVVVHDELGRPCVDLGGWGAVWRMVVRYAHVVAGHKREAIEALARGERLERSGTQSGTSSHSMSEPRIASAG
jgi:hypothetical protein